MEEFLTYVISRLAEYPDDVIISKNETADRITFRVTVRPSDAGKVLGRHGQIIRAIRNVLNSAAGRQRKKAFIEIIR